MGIITKFTFFIIICLSNTLLAAELKVNEKLFSSRLLSTALKESDNISGYWDPSQRDCSGFIRYVYRTALGAPAHLWLDKDGNFVSYASAQDLVHHNFRFISADSNESTIQNGDILVYYSDEKERKDRWHLMLALKNPGALQRTLVVYHNGADKPFGRMRRVWLSEMENVVGQEWRPHATNPKFKGVYRWVGWKK